MWGGGLSLSIRSICLSISRSWACVDGMGDGGAEGCTAPCWSTGSGRFLYRVITRGRNDNSLIDPLPLSSFEVRRANGVGGFTPGSTMASRRLRMWVMSGRFSASLCQHFLAIFQTSTVNPATSIGMGFGGRLSLKTNRMTCESKESGNGTLAVNS